MRKKKNAEVKKTIGESLSDALELPKDVLINMPKMSIFSNKEMTVENYKGVLEYTDTKIRLNTTTYILVISGSELSIKNIATEMITVYGKISNIEFT